MRRGWGVGRSVLRMAMLVALGLSWLGTGAALAFGPVGPDPAHNFPIGNLPLACGSAPHSAVCVNAAVYWLDRARASLHQGPYKLPARFASLSPAKQAFILTNLDRLQYGLPAIPGLTSELDGFAVSGVLHDEDPFSTDPSFPETASNWAGPLPNMPAAYEAWMYNDGPGSPNLDCTPSNHTGCWGHRHDVLMNLGNLGPAAMGAAAGRDSQGQVGYAMILGEGTNSYSPDYYYTWAEATAAGAGSHTYVVHRPPPLEVAVQVKGHELIVTISARPGARLRCQLTDRVGRRWAPAPFFACRAPGVSYPQVMPGRFRLRVKGLGMTVTRYGRVR
jgi:hypothetical protein